MDTSLITTDLRSGIGPGKHEPSEWLDTTSRVAIEKFRHFSADLERRRIRRHNLHVEEEKKVRKELDQLQKDRLRYEREKQLRKKSAKKHNESNSKISSKERSKLPMNENAFGASASIAFDPTVEKYRRRRTRTEPMSHDKRNSKREVSNEEPRVFPYIDESDVQRFHKVCKSAGQSHCRRWGAVWLYAKQEQAAIPEKHNRWKTLMLKTEREKQQAIADKWKLIVNRRAPSAKVQIKVDRNSAWGALMSRRKAVSLCNSEKMATPEKRRPLASNNHFNKEQDLDQLLENCQTDDKNLNSMPGLKSLSSDVNKPLMGWAEELDLDMDVQGLLTPRVNTVLLDSDNKFEKDEGHNAKEIWVSSDAKVEVECMPKLEVKPKRKSALSTTSTRGSRKEQNRFHLQQVVTAVRRNDKMRHQ